jgi:hypothetical protein
MLLSMTLDRKSRDYNMASSAPRFDIRRIFPLRTFDEECVFSDRLCGLEVRVVGCRARGHEFDS